MKKKTGTGRHRSMLDLFLILMLAVCLVGGGVRAYGLHSVTNAPVQDIVSVELQSDGVDAQVAKGVRVGEVLYLQDGSVFGTVSEVQSVSFAVTLIDGGEPYVGEWDPARRCRVRITVECSGSLRDGMLLLGGKTPLGIGETISLIGEKSELSYRIQRVIS